MSYFLSKLKEQASSFQNIAKNIIVYDNTDDKDNDDDEEVLDRLDDEVIG